MKKKIGASKSMKKYEMAGTVSSGPGDGKDSIPSGSKISPEVLDKIKKRAGADKSEILPGTKYKPNSPREAQRTPWGNAPKPGSKQEVEYYKKGGSVGMSKTSKMSKGGSAVKPTMKMGGAVKKSSKKK